MQSFPSSINFNMKYKEEDTLFIGDDALENKKQG